MEPQCFSASAKDTDTQYLCIGVFLFSCVNSLVGLVNIPYQNRQTEYCTQTGTTGQQDIHDAIQDGGNEDQDDHDEVKVTIRRKLISSLKSRRASFPRTWMGGIGPSQIQSPKGRRM